VEDIMSLFTLDTDRIVRMFNANGLKMSLKKAFEVAGYIENIHLERLNEVENNAWAVARKEADERVRVASDVSYDEGLAAGKRVNASAIEYNHVTELVKATLWVEDNISFGNLSKKIRCIKEVRTKFPMLGLRDCKVIIDNATGNGAGLFF
jgi:ribosomal protein L7/L12